MADLSVFTPEPRIVVAGGREFSLTPLKIGQLNRFARAVAPVGGSLLAGDLSTAFVHGYDHLRAAVAIGASVEETWLDDLDADEFLALGTAVVEVNASFFAQRLMPAIKASAAAITGTMVKAQAGAGSSPR